MGTSKSAVEVESTMKIIILFLLLTVAFGAPGNGKSRDMKKREMRSMKRREMRFLGKKSLSMMKERTGTCDELWKGDNFCDDENNNAGCDWDGGDCCGGDTDIYSYGYAYNYCTECLCLDPNYEGPNPNNEICYGWSGWKGDGYCDDENDNSGCEWDGGDCCGLDVAQSLCLDPNYTGPTGPVSEGCHDPYWQGDGYCDDENNNSGCEWDGGDCCGLDVDTSFCTECACLDADSGYMHKR